MIECKPKELSTRTKMELNQKDFADYVGVSRQAIVKMTKKGFLKRRTDKYYDTKEPANLSYYALKNNGKRQQPDPNRFKPPKPLRKDRLIQKQAKAKKPVKKKPVKKKIKEYVSPHEEDNQPIPEQLSLIGISDKELVDLELEKLIRLKLAEEIRAKRLKLDIDRGDLIPKDYVRSVFGEFLSIMQNEFLQLGNNVSAEIAGKLGATNVKKTLSVKKHLDKKTRKCLEHIQRKMNKFFKKHSCEEIKL